MWCRRCAESAVIGDRRGRGGGSGISGVGRIIQRLVGALAVVALCVYLTGTLAAAITRYQTGRMVWYIGFRCRRRIPPETAHHLSIVLLNWMYHRADWIDAGLDRRPDVPVTHSQAAGDRGSDADNHEPKARPVSWTDIILLLWVGLASLALVVGVMGILVHLSR